MSVFRDFEKVYIIVALDQDAPAQDSSSNPPTTDTNNKNENTGRYDWFSVYKNSRMPNFSDFKKFVKLKEDELVGNGHQKVDFIAQCVFDGEICNSSSFRTFQHELYGNCFTFNSIVDARNSEELVGKARRTSKVGSENGLSLSLFLEIEEFLGSIGQFLGARFAIHNANEYPPLVTRGFEVGVGTATTLALRQELTLRESDPFSDCAEAWPPSLELTSNYKNYRYTLEFCTFLCKQQTLAEVCGCSDTFDWNFSKNPAIRDRAKVDCDVWNSTEYECLQTVYTEFAEGKRSCDCPNPCEERHLRVFSSTTAWPTMEYTPHLISLLKDSPSSTIRKFISVRMSQTDGLRDKWRLQQSVKENFAAVQIYFESMVYTKIKESPKYNLSTLFGTLGGNLGLWLGWSLLSLLEFFQWFSMSSVLMVSLAGKASLQKGKTPEIQ